MNTIEQIERLKKSLSSGPYIFVLKTGGMYGTLMFLFMTGQSNVFKGKYSISSNAIIWCFIGFMYGFVMFKYSQYKLNKLLNAHEVFGEKVDSVEECPEKRLKALELKVAIIVFAICIVLVIIPYVCL